jgi:hypothetical protein
MKELYNENYKTLKKEIEDTIRWEVFSCSQIGKINMQKWLYYQKQSTYYRQFSSKSQCHSSQK